jgi:hypothetical protein
LRTVIRGALLGILRFKANNYRAALMTRRHGLSRGKMTGTEGKLMSKIEVEMAAEFCKHGQVSMNKLCSYVQSSRRALEDVALATTMNSDSRVTTSSFHVRDTHVAQVEIAHTRTNFMDNTH